MPSHAANPLSQNTKPDTVRDNVVPALKPRLERRFGVWRCWLLGTRIAGFGHTPKEAWDEYARQFAQWGVA
jgi:hypothetical protein